MISIINSKGTITICKVESIEIDNVNHRFIINEYVMEEADFSIAINGKQKRIWESNAFCLRNEILNILHDKAKGSYVIYGDLKLKKVRGE